MFSELKLILIQELKKSISVHLVPDRAHNDELIPDVYLNVASSGKAEASSQGLSTNDSSGSSAGRSSSRSSSRTKFRPTLGALDEAGVPSTDF
ncbi:unnamed protein product [Gongylonema pulchrum]|uniref:VPS13 domain-containing protein n=1 Tax=Gongylonema pulchrum TaxID=637853 RepID=A0A183DU90_9BILA|nr:unnamed protein product [Gongylonema pulchrum]